MENQGQTSNPGETAKDNAIVSTIESLTNGENNQAIIENLQMYIDAGRGFRTSIFHENIEASEKKMFMSEHVYGKMKSLMEETARTKKEHAFLTLGWVHDGDYMFSDIFSDLDIADEVKEQFYTDYPDFKTNESAADLNIILYSYWNVINSHIDEMRAKGVRPLVSLGHTHPDVSESFGNYSLPDLVYIAEQEGAIRGNRSEDEFEYCHIVLPVNGDVDCMTFDKADKRFRKITNVMSVGQASVEEVPAYTFVSPKTLAGTSYVEEEDESVKDGLYTESIRQFISSHQWDGLSDA